MARELQTWSTAVAVDSVLGMEVFVSPELQTLAIASAPWSGRKFLRRRASQTGSTAAAVDAVLLVEVRCVVSIRSTQRLMGTETVYDRHQILDARS